MSKSFASVARVPSLSLIGNLPLANINFTKMAAWKMVQPLTIVDIVTIFADL